MTRSEPPAEVIEAVAEAIGNAFVYIDRGVERSLSYWLLRPSYQRRSAADVDPGRVRVAQAWDQGDGGRSWLPTFRERRQGHAMTALEKLARRICWLGWARRPKEHTEAAYWISLPPETQRRYINEAALLLSNVRSIMRAESSQALLWEADRERDQEKATSMKKRLGAVAHHMRA